MANIQDRPLASGRHTFHLRSWQDLVDKLNFEIDEYDRTRISDADPKWRTYRAVNAALTAWHIHDWLWSWVEEDRPELEAVFGTVLGVDFGRWKWHGRRLKQFGIAVADRYRPLAICRTVATAAKHAKSEEFPDNLVTAPVHVVQSSFDPEHSGTWYDLRLFTDATIHDADQWLKQSAASWTDFFMKTGLWDVKQGWL